MNGLRLLACASLFGWWLLGTADANSLLAADTDGGTNFTDMHSAVEKSFRRTKLRDRKEGSYNEARGRPINVTDFKTLGMSGRLEYYVQTKRDPETDLVSSAIVTKTSFAEAVERESSAQTYTQRDLASRRKHQWRGYSVQYQVDGDMVLLASRDLPDRAKRAFFGQIETLRIPLSAEELFAPVKRGSAITITLHSDMSPDMQITLPFSYLVGFFAKASEHGLVSTEQAALATRLRAAIKAKAAD